MYPVNIINHEYLPPQPSQDKITSEALADYVARTTLRRMSHYERLGLLSAIKCMENATGDFKVLPCPAQRMGIAVATCYGPVDSTFSFLDSALESGHNLTSPTAFSTSVYNILSTIISMHMNITGPALTVSQGGLSLCAAITRASLWLASGEVDYVLLGAVDQYSSYLNSLIIELEDPAIRLSQDVALFMLLGNKFQPRGNHQICNAGFGLHAGENTLCNLETAELLYEDITDAPCGPVHSIIRAMNQDTALPQRCCMKIGEHGLCYIDIKRNHE